MPTYEVGVTFDGTIIVQSDCAENAIDIVREMSDGMLMSRINGSWWVDDAQQIND